MRIDFLGKVCMDVLQDVHHVSNTAYGSDNYTDEFEHPVWAPGGWTSLIRGHPCYDPAKVIQWPPQPLFVSVLA